jgi:hypothetical protein
MKLQIAVLTGVLAFVFTLPSCTPPSWVSEAESIVKVALPVVAGISSITGGGPAVTEVVNDLNILTTLFDKYQATPDAGVLADVQNGLNTVNSDLAQIMPAAHLQNSDTQNKVAAIVQLVAGEFSSITDVVAANNPRQKFAVRSPRSAAVPRAPAITLDHTKFKKQYDAIIADDPRFPKL